MLFAFDANISFRIVEAIKTSEILYNSNVEVVQIEKKYGRGIQDIPWIEQFSSEGGKAFISADKRIRTRPAKQDAYRQAGLKAIFLFPKWHRLRLNQQISLIFLKWPHIHEKILNMNDGDSCELLIDWKTDDKLDSHFRNL